MPISATIRYQHDFRQMTPAVEREAGADAASAAAHWWEHEFKPIHFTPAAENRYAYTDRSARYMIRKAMRYHHQNPLEFTGKSKAIIMQDHTPEKDDGKGQAKIVIRGLQRYWFMQRRSGHPINKSKELATILPSEEQKLAEVSAPVFMESLSRHLPPSTTTI